MEFINSVIIVLITVLIAGGLAFIVDKLRHKTKHIKFMAGLPLIIILQSLFITFVLLFLHRIKGV